VKQCGLEVWQAIFDFSGPKSNEFPYVQVSPPLRLCSHSTLNLSILSFVPVLADAKETGNESFGN